VQIIGDNSVVRLDLRSRLTADLRLFVLNYHYLRYYVRDSSGLDIREKCGHVYLVFSISLLLKRFNYLILSGRYIHTYICMYLGGNLRLDGIQIDTSFLTQCIHLKH